MVKLACATTIWGEAPLGEALAAIAALGFAGVETDLGEHVPRLLLRLRAARLPPSSAAATLTCGPRLALSVAGAVEVARRLSLLGGRTALGASARRWTTSGGNAGS